MGVGNSDGTVQLWDVASSKLIRSMAGHSDRVSLGNAKQYLIHINFPGGLFRLEPTHIGQRGEGGNNIAA